MRTINLESLRRVSAAAPTYYQGTTDTGLSFSAYLRYEHIEVTLGDITIINRDTDLGFFSFDDLTNMCLRSGYFLNFDEDEVTYEYEEIEAHFKNKTKVEFIKDFQGKENTYKVGTVFLIENSDQEFINSLVYGGLVKIVSVYD